MQRILCKSKITNVFITAKDAACSGSIGIDKAICEAADILPGEQVHVLNVNSGERFVTYVIEEQENSGKIALYGPAVRKGEVNDELVLLSYCFLETKECYNFSPRIISLAKNNKCRPGK